MSIGRFTKGIPSVPDVPQQLTEDDIYRILEPLKRIIDIRQGQFDPLDRWVTQQDLIDAGLQTEQAVAAPVTIIPPTQQYNFNLIGDVVGGPTLLGNGNAAMSTAINLPNITEIDGGNAFSTYTAQPSGPYGVSAGPSNTITSIFEFNASAGQTTFIGGDKNGNTLSYIVGKINVAIMGVLLDSADFTASNGSSVVLAEAAQLDQPVTIIAYSA